MPRKITQLLTGGALTVCLCGSPAEASLWPHQQHELKRLLNSEDAKQRRAAIRRTSELPAHVAQVLIKQALLDDDREVRLIAIRVARGLGYHELSKEVVDWFSSQQADERIEALRLVSLEPDEASISLIESACIDADAGVRRAAVVALGTVPHHFAARASAKLIGMLDDIDPEVRREVAASLGRLGEPSAALTLAAHLKDQDANVRAQVALALGALGSNAVISALLVALSDAHDDVVAAVVASLGELGAEEAILSLAKMAEGAPHRPQTREAILALARLSRFPAARKVVVDLLGSPDHIALVRSVLAESHRELGAIAEDCVRTYSAELAYHCAFDLLRSGGAPEIIISAYREGRLTVAQVLSILEGRGTREATLLALESLSSSAIGDEQSAMRYLSKTRELSLGADAPLMEALRTRPRPTSETVMLLNAMSLVHAGGRPLGKEKTKRIRAYLSSTVPEVKSAAALVLAARGTEGKELRELLLGDGYWAKGALEGLTLRMTEAQAETLIELCREGKSGRNDAFFSVFWKMPSGLSDSAKSGALALLEAARGADRDALFYPLIRNWDATIEKALTKRASSRADLLKIAQLAWYQPKALSLVRRLTKNNDAHVAAAAARALGRHGKREDADILQELATSQRPYIVRAAALTGMRLALYQGVGTEGQKSILSSEVCSSSHDLYRAEALRLAALHGVDCDGRPIEDVLLRDPDPRMRRVAASLVAAMNPESSALRRCGFYEPRVEVAQICRGSRPAVMEGSDDEQMSTRSVPYQTLEVRARGTIARLVPVAVRVPSELLGPKVLAAEHVMRLTTDRAGHVIIPREGGELVDATWHF